MRTLTEIHAERDEARAKRDRAMQEIRDMNERVGERSLTPGEQSRWDDTNKSLDKAVTQLEDLRDEEVAEIARLAGVRGAVQPGSEPKGGLQHLRRGEAWGDEARGASMADRARKALELVEVPDSVDADATRSRITEILENQREEPMRAGNPLLEEWLVVASNPSYVRGFQKVLRDPRTGPMLLTDEERAAFGEVRAWELRTAMNEGTTTAGGFMVPAMLDPAIVLTNNGVVNPMRQIATVKTIATKTYTGVTSAGVTAEWKAEAVQSADASPTVGTISITPNFWDAYVQASFELAMDSDIGSELAVLIADARDRLHGAAFTNGTGSGQPNGVITVVSGVTASRVSGTSGAGGAADFVIGDIYAVDNALPTRHRPGSSWQAQITVLNKIRRFGESIQSNAGFWTDLGAGVPPTLLGHSIYENGDMDSTIVSGSNDDVLILGDFAKYYIVDRIGTQLIHNPLVLGANQRPTAEVGWFAWGRTGGDVIDANAFRLLRL